MSQATLSFSGQVDVSAGQKHMWLTHVKIKPG